ncbi:MAG: hypothetical protein JRJ65_14990 [Deltaproteobacteria bacterium]|nr:hypothetical protein [Deltaproteobacteria bacterium]
MAKDCCWNCKYYIVRGDNEPAFLGGASSNVCIFSDDESVDLNWEKRAEPTPPNYVCRYYKERFY